MAKSGNAMRNQKAYKLRIWQNYGCVSQIVIAQEFKEATCSGNYVIPARVSITK